MSGPPSPKIDGERLWRSLSALGEIGAYTDERTGLVGVSRLALSDDDARGRAQVKAWFEEAGLEVRVDRIGNCYGRRAGTEDGPPVMVGSHIDSVPTAGRFDGCLGVLGGLEVVRALNDAERATRLPIEVAFFTEEEGCRFGTDMLGSAVATGRIPLEEAYACVDRAGLTVGEELQRIGWVGEAPVRREVPAAFVELHIEQGPVLERSGLELGVVTGVQGISWQELTLLGKSAHAGTTPMNLRKDAGLFAARVNVRMHEMCASGEYGEHMRATMGRIDPVPGLVNIVPGRLVCSIDLRNPDDEAMARAERDLASFVDALSEQMGIGVERRQTARTSRVAFDDAVAERISRCMEQRGIEHARLISGAGHDAQEWASLCPTAMIFTRGEHEGISHNPREFTSEATCAAGVQVLCDVLVGLAS